MEKNKRGFDVSEFRSKTLDYHRLSHFLMELGMPAGLKNSLENNAQNNLKNAHKNLHFFIEASTMPGVSLGTDEIRRYGHGQVERKPYAAVFTEVDILVRSDPKGLNYDFFQSWLKLIVNYDSRLINDRRTPDDVSNPNRGIQYSGAFEVSYKDFYKTESTITSFDNEGNEVVSLKLKDCFPIYLGDIQYNWSNGNQIVAFPVKLVFSSWYQERNYQSLPDGPVNTPPVTP
jgi:hypothetical protein